MSKLLPKKIIIDDQLCLMLFEEEFAPALLDLAKNNYEYFIKFISWISKITSLEDELNYIRRCNAEYNSGLSANYALFLEGTGIIGSIGFNRIEKMDINFNEASIGYWLAPSFQRKGYMQKSLKSLIQTALATTDIRSFLIKTSSNNDKSISLAKSNNFQFFKLEPNGFRIADEIIDLAIYQKKYLPSPLS